MEEKQSSIFTSIALIVLAVLMVAGLIGVLIYSHFEQQEANETQNRYQAEIKKIETYLKEGNCAQAALEYDQAKVTRHDIDKRGLYYSFDSHSEAAHSLDIAECFAEKKKFSRAVELLDREGGRGPDYFLRASVIYKNAGELSKAQAAKAKGESF